ncbi:hypothetical protein [Rhodopirellula sallentina]|uniref:Uncharacterized protein n=1 Tax=Rhodopirellula sallentina SM41 TaxID=1263870 RepID=M5U5E1_9BACT|nr:hypothetical protein [Rhodopirellula sallentina]EMI56672.1 hypothetical protein RSSM_01854 [Rhodopirellula sallentina SM41]
MAHRIRLRKPWTRREHWVNPTEDTNGDSPPADDEVRTQQVDVPDNENDSSDGREVARERLGHVCYLRRFNSPTGIETAARVELEIGEVSGRLDDVRINSQSLSAIESCDGGSRFDLTDCLSRHNELEIQICGEGATPRLLGAVNLWIIETE